MCATVTMAQAQVKAGGPEAANALELADLFCRNSRRRVEESFRHVADNDDEKGYQLAKDVLEGRITWLEEGVFNVDDLLGAAEAAAVAQRSAS
jgi:hypothetical protein